MPLIKRVFAEKMIFDEVNGLDANEMMEFEIVVSDSSVPLRVTMVYSDFPGEDIINNLNLGTKSDKVVNDMRTDKPRSTGNEDFLRCTHEDSA